MRLCAAIEAYVGRRRAEGHAFVNQAGRLRKFGKHAGDIELHLLTTEEVVHFLKLGNLSEITRRERHATVARFIGFWQARGLAPQVIMPPLARYARQFFTSHIYSTQELRRILKATAIHSQGTQRSTPPETMRMLILFLYGTGATPQSCVALRTEDLDLDAGMVTLKNRQGHGARTVPINENLLRVVRRYQAWKLKQELVSPYFFLRSDGGHLVAATIGSHFRRLLEIAGCVRRDGLRCRPRLYDFKATFAVRRITTWIRSGDDLGRMLPALAAYMGQIDLTTTERFLAQSPDRFRKELDKLSPAQGPEWSQDKPLLAFLLAL